MQQFIVCHFAGEVTYDVEGFVEKNKDSVSEIITECLSSSSLALIKSIY
jgi:myosin heavy subunit